MYLYLVYNKGIALFVVAKLTHGYGVVWRWIRMAALRYKTGFLTFYRPALHERCSFICQYPTIYTDRVIPCKFNFVSRPKTSCISRWILRYHNPVILFKINFVAGLWLSRMHPRKWKSVASNLCSDRLESARAETDSSPNIPCISTAV